MANALKAVSKTDERLIVENHIVLFGGRDLEGHLSPNVNADGSRGEYFSKSVDLASPYTDVGVLYVDWEHGYAPEGEPQKDDVLGYVDWRTAKADDDGVIVQRILNRRNRYVQMLEPLIEAGLIGTSSEAIPQGVRKANTGEITRWPLRRDTLTVTPMEPRMLDANTLRTVKALADEWPALKALLMEPQEQKAQLFDVSGDTNTGVMVALYPPADVAAQIAAMDGVETPAEELHVTLAYYGDADKLTSAQIAGAIEKVRQMGIETAPVKGRLGGIGRFSASESSDNMDVLYLNVDSPGIERLRISLVERLYQMRPQMNHGYTPHMTLAYVPIDADMPITKWPAMPITFDAISIVVGDKREDFPFTGSERNAVESADEYKAAADIEQPEAEQLAAVMPEADTPEAGGTPAAAAVEPDATHAKRLALEIELLALEVE